MQSKREYHSTVFSESLSYRKFRHVHRRESPKQPQMGSYLPIQAQKFRAPFTVGVFFAYYSRPSRCRPIVMLPF
jgi:hypothetical protein